MAVKAPQPISTRPLLNESYRALAESFRRTLLAENKSPKTIKTYCEAVNQLRQFLAAQGMPGEPTHITREHVESFVTDQLSRWKPATALNRYRGLTVFFTWLLEEGEIRTSPMANMKTM